MTATSNVVADTKARLARERGGRIFCDCQSQVKQDLDPFHRDLLTDEAGNPILDANGDFNKKYSHQKQNRRGCIE